MSRRNWLWTALVAVPLAVAGGFVYAKATATTYLCPLTGEELPCPDCCPLNQEQSSSQPSCCDPPCCPPDCCPTNDRE